MANVITRLGTVSVGGLAPSIAGLVATTSAQIKGLLTGALRVSGLLSITPPTIYTQIQAAARLATQLQAQLAGGVTPPAVNLTGNVSAVAVLQGQAALTAELAAALSTGGASLEVYRYDGTAAGLGPAVTVETAGGVTGGAPGDACHALVIVTRSDAAFEALGKVLIT